MATPQRTVRSLPATGPNGTYSTPQGIDAPDIDDADLMAVESWDAPNVTASVYRRHPIPPGMPSNKALYCGKHPTPCDVDVLRESYGGGLYSVLFTDQNGRRVGQKTIAIEGSPKVIGIDTKAPQPQYPPLLYAQPVQPQDPTLIAILDRMDRLTQAVLQQQSQPQSTTVDRLNEMKTMAEVMRSISGAPVANDPTEYVRWLRQGVQVGREMAVGDVGGAGQEEPSWVKPVIEAIPQVLDFLDRRASAVARGASSSAPRRVVGPPPLPKPGMPTSAPGREARPEVQDESAAGLPKWILQTAREFIREIKQETNDAEYMAAWISRNVPVRIIQSWSEKTPSVVRAEIMRLAPLVQKGGVILSEDFVSDVVRVLLMDDEPATATVVDATVLDAPDASAPSVTLGSVTAGGAVSGAIGDAPANLRFDEDDDDEDDDDDEEDDDEEDDDDDSSDDDDDDEETDDDDDDDDDLELKVNQEESGPKG